MKIERINENQIRCTLTSLDLSARNLNLGELAYGSEKAKKLFREMIQQASAEVGFDAEDIPLMVEAIPLSNESIMLIITKIEDPEELDTRFSRFSPSSEEDETGADTLTRELLEGADSLLDLISPESKEAAKAFLAAHQQGDAGEKAGAAGREGKGSSLSQRIFCFNSLDAAGRAARVGGQVFEGESRLYKNERSGKYYLYLKESTPNSPSFIRFCNLLIEYGTSVKAQYATDAYFGEHYDCIIRQNAVAVLRKL